MIEIPTVDQIVDWESHQDTTDLIERACKGFVDWFVSKFSNEHKSVGIVCGTGNNGADGLGIARLLRSKNYDVTVWIIKRDKQSDGFKNQFERLPKDIPVIEIADAKSFNHTHQRFLIDAIFGVGLSRDVEGIYADVIRAFNARPAIKVAVDIPSGLKADKPSSGEIIKADHTVTFLVPKLALMFPSTAEFVGEWHLVNMGFKADFGSRSFYIDDEAVRSMLHPRKKFSHKGDYGRALLIAGSSGKMGAAVLAAKATLRSGAGLLTVHVPKCGYNIIQTSVPEAMATIDVNEDHFSDAGETSNYNVIGIGPGLGITASTVSGLRKALQAGKPMVIDADALNILSSSRELIHLIPAGSILTPHPGEFRRLAGEWTNDFNRFDLQRRLAEQTQCVVILKGAHTSVVHPRGTTAFNSTGNPGMAKGGSGDVLTGVLTGLLSQGYSAWEAAIIGVFLHGRAGDLAVEKTGQYSMVAGDLVEFLGQSFSR